ncbi:MAG: hypothetical protein J6328_00430 [Bacilli bacterium]|nr:hypothetical protein [Bacilli bacterium]
MEQKDINETFEQPIENPSESSIGETQVAYSIKDFFKMVGKHWIGLVIGLLLGLSAGVIYGRYVQKPKYQATATIYIWNDDASDKLSEKTSTAKNMARLTYNYMTQNEVREQACKLLSGESTYTEFALYADEPYKNLRSDSDGEIKYATGTLGGYYSVTLEQFNSSDTSIFLHITATTKNADLSKDVANAIMYSAVMLTGDTTEQSSQIAKSLKDFIHPLSPANSAKNTATSTAVLAVVGLFGGAILGALYGILREMLNTRVSTKKELEIITGIKVIGMIPDYLDKNVSESTLEIDDAKLKEASKEGE